MGEVGEPQRIIEVEPAEPVPTLPPVEEPAEPRRVTPEREPEKVPAGTPSDAAYGPLRPRVAQDIAVFGAVLGDS